MELAGQNSAPLKNDSHCRIRPYHSFALTGSLILLLFIFQPFLGKLAANLGYDMKALLDFKSHKLWNAYDALLVQVISSKPI